MKNAGLQIPCTQGWLPGLRAATAERRFKYRLRQRVFGQKVHKYERGTAGCVRARRDDEVRGERRLVLVGHRRRRDAHGQEVRAAAEVPFTHAIAPILPIGQAPVGRIRQRPVRRCPVPAMCRQSRCSVGKFRGLPVPHRVGHAGARSCCQRRPRRSADSFGGLAPADVRGVSEDLGHDCDRCQLRVAR